MSLSLEGGSKLDLPWRLRGARAERGFARGATHASHGRAWTTAPGLRGVWTAQRNGQSTGFLRDAGSQKRRKFARSFQGSNACVERAAMGVTHALRGWPRAATQGLNAAGIAQLNGRPGACAKHGQCSAMDYSALCASPPCSGPPLRAFSAVARRRAQRPGQCLGVPESATIGAIYQNHRRAKPPLPLLPFAGRQTAPASVGILAGRYSADIDV
jgi:hypothetical protein